MASNEITPVNLPDWYRIERETEKAIVKLSTVKELDFYLKNPDENIRRLSIIRLSTLKLKDSENFLKEVLNDDLENNQNKELAAWSIKAAALKWNMDIFINHRYLSRFTGSETFDELYKVTFGDLLPQIKFDFSSNPTYNALMKELPESACIRDISFNANIDAGQWINTLLSSLLKNYKIVLKGVFIFPLKLLKILFTAVFIKTPIIIVKMIIGMIRRMKERHSTDKYSRRTNNYYKRYGRDGYKTRLGILTRLKNLIFSILYIVCFPLRLIFRYKAAIFCIVAILYCFLAFTGYGKNIAAKQFNINLIQFHNGAINTARQFSSNILHKLDQLTGIGNLFENKTVQQSGSTETEIPDEILYQVTAVNGLNIRKSPDTGSEKISGNPLAFGSVVTYMTKSKSDSSGRLWYYILSPDGRAGWVSAKFLKEKKG